MSHFYGNYLIICDLITWSDYMGDYYNIIMILLTMILHTKCVGNQLNNKEDN